VAAGFVHDRRLMREAQVNLAIRWFCGYGLHETLPDHSSLTRIRQRWGAERFRQIFERTVRACLEARVAKAEIVHIDDSLIRADVSWESLVARHLEAVAAANPPDDEVGWPGYSVRSLRDRAGQSYLRTSPGLGGWISDAVCPLRSGKPGGPTLLRSMRRAAGRGLLGMRLRQPAGR
jgi:Transposase domain (DUF772)